MTGWDTAFCALAVLDLLFVGFLVWTALQMMQTAKRGQRSVTPAIQEAKALAAIGKTLATRTREQGLTVADRVKDVAGRVKQRYETTRRIIGELKPRGEETAETVQQTAAMVRERKEELARKARAVGEIARGISRVRSAAEAAAEVARSEGQ